MGHCRMDQSVLTWGQGCWLWPCVGWASRHRRSPMGLKDANPSAGPVEPDTSVKGRCHRVAQSVLTWGGPVGTG